MLRAPHALLLSALVLAGCKPKDDFYGKTFHCDPAKSPAQCGTSADGKALVCFGGKQLGVGSDFCTEPCTGEGTEGSDAVCLAGARLRTCDPKGGTAEDPDGCGPNLACFRTDLVESRGVCLAMSVCERDTDCKDTTISTCASTVLANGYPQAGYQLNHLQCVVGGCNARQTVCHLGQTCLPKVVPATTAVPDICVPNCDSQLNCPPNYTCWRKVSGPASPNVCLPTLPGMRCTSSLDCMAGDCIDSTLGFSVCALPCGQDADCVKYSDSSTRQYCVSPRGDGKKYCMAVSPYAGALCLEDAGCPIGQKCHFTSPARPYSTIPGECRYPCEPDGTCPPRGGYPFGCLVRPEGKSCYPGTLGMHCLRNEECLQGTTCEKVPLDERQVAGWSPDLRNPADAGAATTTQICTRPCQGDDDCRDGWGAQQGFCEGNWCRAGGGPGVSGKPGAPCTRDQQCGRGKCELPDGGTLGACLAPPPPGARSP